MLQWHLRSEFWGEIRILLSACYQAQRQVLLVSPQWGARGKPEREHGPLPHGGGLAPSSFCWGLCKATSRLCELLLRGSGGKVCDSWSSPVALTLLVLSPGFIPRHYSGEAGAEHVEYLGACVLHQAHLAQLPFVMMDWLEKQSAAEKNNIFLFTGA